MNGLLVENRGTEFEMPKALRGRGIGREIPPPQPTRDLGECRKLPKLGQGRSPGRKRILVHYELEKKQIW